MKFIPNIGLSTLPFGSSSTNVFQILGRPRNKQQLPDEPTHPSNRIIYDYGKYDVLLTPSLGLISFTLGAEEVDVELFDVQINSLNAHGFIRLLDSNNFDHCCSELDSFGDIQIYSAGAGIIAGYCESQLTDFELFSPSVWY
ncbi:hypothetical protein [Calycomorphotria hydatis]|uniref:Uncharacterized protein n=1 Tax=Calycomorphotria hydatis TaxID=2528027 RepID=A0A517T6I1_9PLAN|nr:hypothetical protein [Calycomorphotria hydatis]QDT63984.1 hypothetical protein V22_12140 [Calycomorphotria hydatis]